MPDAPRMGPKPEPWLILDGFVLDVAPFVDEHPGGAKLLQADFGKDATAKFDGAVYNHSNAANNWLIPPAPMPSAWPRRC